MELLLGDLHADEGRWLSNSNVYMDNSYIDILGHRKIPSAQSVPYAPWDALRLALWT